MDTTVVEDIYASKPDMEPIVIPYLGSPDPQPFEIGMSGFSSKAVYLDNAGKKATYEDYVYSKALQKAFYQGATAIPEIRPVPARIRFPLEPRTYLDDFIERRHRLDALEM